MRAVLVLVLGLSSYAPAMAQVFSSPLDVVDTLYNSYLLDAPPSDISPYFSDTLKDQLQGLTIGSAQFRAAGFDLVTGFLRWEPLDLSISTIDQNKYAAKVRVTFTQDNAPAQIDLDLVNEPDNGWQIDHIAGKVGARTWCTNAIVEIAKGVHSPAG